MWMPGAIGPTPNDQHRLKSPTSHAGHTGVDAARPARQPRVQHDPVADLEPFGLGTERDDVGHDLVPEHLRQREEAFIGLSAIAAPRPSP